MDDNEFEQRKTKLINRLEALKAEALARGDDAMEMPLSDLDEAAFLLQEMAKREKD